MDKQMEHTTEHSGHPILVKLLPLVILDEPKITIDNAIKCCEETKGPVLVQWENNRLVLMTMKYYTKHYASFKITKTMHNK